MAEVIIDTTQKIERPIVIQIFYAYHCSVCGRPSNDKFPSCFHGQGQSQLLISRHIVQVS